MTVELSDGDIFASDCEALVSPVDCTGIQGAGLALAFTRIFPRQTAWYRGWAPGNAEPGRVYHVLPKDGGDRLSAARWVLGRHRRYRDGGLVLFATTKAHWSKPSSLSWVIGCCQALAEVVGELGVESIGLPALGVGLGGLPWDDVRPILLASAERVPARVVVYGPR